MLEESPPSEENKPSGDAPVPEMSPITDESPVPQTGRSSGGRISEDPRPDTEGTAGSSEEREAAECHASVSVGDISPLQASSGRSDLPCSTGQSNDSSAKPCDVCGESTTHERTSDAGHGTSDARHGSSAVPSHVTGNGTSGNRLAEESDPLTSAETETSACSQIPKSIEDSSVLKQRFMNRTEDGSADLLPSGTKGLLENGHEDKEHSCMVDSGTSSNSRLPLCENGADSVAMGDNFHPRNPPMKNVELSEPAVSLPCAEKCVAWEEAWDTAEIRFFAVRSPRRRVSGYCTKWQIQGKFIARIRVRQTSTVGEETQYLASILSGAFVKCICRNNGRAQGKWTSMATNADQWKRRQIRISADQWKWRQTRISAVSRYGIQPSARPRRGR